MAARKSATVAIMPKPDRRWEVEDALRTLARAEEIRCDAKLMADVKRAATNMQRAVNKSGAR